MEGTVSVCVIDLDSIDTSFINYCRSFDYDKTMEIYSCESGVHSLLNSICPSELYPAMLLIDYSGKV